MNWLRQIRPLPHEWFFGAFLLVTWVRLIAVAGPFDPNALLYLALMLISATLITWCTARETRLRWLAGYGTCCPSSSTWSSRPWVPPR